MVFTQKFLLELNKSLFNGRGVEFKGKKIPLRYSGGLRNFRIGRFLFIEQNPRKKTKWAKMVDKGYEIAWLIDMENNKYLYRVVNGEVFRL